MSHAPDVPTPDRELTAERLLPASVAQVYRAWVEPSLLARWWGPRGFTNEFEVCEPRPGGRWTFVMVSADGARYRNEASFAELTPGHRVIIDHVSPPLFRLVATFEPAGDQTRVRLRQVFPSSTDRDKVRSFAEPANHQNLERLAEVVADGRARQEL